MVDNPITGRLTAMAPLRVRVLLLLLALPALVLIKGRRPTARRTVPAGSLTKAARRFSDPGGIAARGSWLCRHTRAMLTAALESLLPHRHIGNVDAQTGSAILARLS